MHVNDSSWWQEVEEGEVGGDMGPTTLLLYHFLNSLFGS